MNLKLSDISTLLRYFKQANNVITSQLRNDLLVQDFITLLAYYILKSANVLLYWKLLSYWLIHP